MIMTLLQFLMTFKVFSDFFSAFDKTKTVTKNWGVEMLLQSQRKSFH